MRTSESLDKLLPAYLKARPSFAPLVADETARVMKDGREQYSFEYATLHAVNKATDAALHHEGLVLIGGSVNTPEGEGFNLILRLYHAPSGQWIESAYPLRSDLTIQQQGSQLTYLRRYLAVNLLWLVVADDDGAEAEKAWAPTKTTQQAPAKQSQVAPLKATKGDLRISEKQQKRLFAIAKGAGWSTADVKRVILKEAGVEHSADIQVGKYPGEYDALCALFEAGPDAYAAGAADADEDFGADAADGTEDNPF